MDTEKKPFQISWREIIIVTLIIAALIVTILGAWLPQYPPRVRANADAKNGKAIREFLLAYANDNNGQFPEAQQASNEAFRQLFMRKYTDYEQGFAIANDPWLNNAPGGNKKPDNDIGEKPDFAQALAPGECSWAYVTGLTRASEPTLPLMANAFTESVGIYTKDKTKKGGVFRGEKAVWISVGGTVKVVDLQEDLMILERKGGRGVNVFQSEWGTKAEDVKNPAG